MTPGDIRAVENPISAMFDLADQVNAEAPRVRKLVRYASAFIAFWLVLDFILILATAKGNILISIFLGVMFAVGIFTLLSLRNLNDFFKYYALRHNYIKSVRDADPIVLVPKGSNSVERFKTYLIAINPEMASTLALMPSPSVSKGRSGVFYQWDLYLLRRPNTLWPSLGLGYPGYQLFLKYFDKAPTVEDVSSMKRAVEDVMMESHAPASRIVLLWSRSKEDVSEAVYNLITTQNVVFTHRGSSFICGLELVIENEDGTYEFIPFMAPHSSSKSLAQAGSPR
jgi:hypothetical protein